MTRTLYFADKTLLFTTDSVAEADCLLPADDISRTKILKIFDTCNVIALLTADPGAAFDAFARQFTSVTAAGGAVVDERRRTLMIRRNGRWDLPKGHWEAGETIERCALREVAEETGVEARIVRPLCVTCHAYYFPPTERWELKHTHWFEMRPVAAGTLTPQSEEGISRAEWIGQEALAEPLRTTYPTIRQVFDALKQ